MAGTSRIDELRKKFDENPRRYFAPLANEYRKIGDFDQAIFICQEFLPQQPGHMSGHIVYGQALFESGRHDEARSVFETALALDPENLIALRHLGDIARAHGDSDTARAWYRRVLESDPRNEEIAGILTSLDSEVPSAPAGTAAASGKKPEESSGDAVAGGAISIESAITAATGSDDAPAPANADPIVDDPLTTAPSESSFDDLAKLFTSAAAPVDPAPRTEEAIKPADDSLHLIHEGEDVLVTDSTTAEEARAHLDALVGDRQVAKPAEPAPPEPPAPSFNLPFLEGLTSAPPAAAEGKEAAAPPAPSSPTPAPEPARAAVPDASSAFVTETMAELYVKQGHREQALDVYRQLVQRNPNDAALAARLRALETTGARPATPEAEPNAPVPGVVADAGPTIREFLESIAVFRPRSANSHPQATMADVPNEPPPSRASGSVAGSLGNLFANAEQASAAGVPPTAPRADDFSAPAPSDAASEAHPAPLPGRPSKPAASELSLDHVFRHATPTTGSPSHSSFSFDQFFSQQAQQDVAASDAEPSGQQNAGLSDDIQQFNAWLEGLKKT